MANRRVHNRGGLAAGTGAALYHLRPEADPLEALLEVLGGAAGGYVASAIPDVLEPATSPNHRNVAHSVATATALAVKSRKPVSRYREGLRARADQHRATRRQPSTSTLQSIWHFLCECFYRLAAGAVSAVVPGYLSHLALDAMTPKGIPLLAARLV
jgi:hypothetical protein